MSGIYYRRSARDVTGGRPRQRNGRYLPWVPAAPTPSPAPEPASNVPPQPPPKTTRIVQRERKLKGAGGGDNVRDGIGGIVHLDQ